MRSIENNATTWYAWEGNQVIAEYDDTGSALNWRETRFYLGDRLLATQHRTDGLRFHHPDRLGTRVITNGATGQRLIEQSTLPFGTEHSAESSGTAHTRRFTSYDRSATARLDYAINRFYDPGTGRFTQSDPLGIEASQLEDPQTLNLYAYCGNDPVNAVDPDGLFFKRLFKWLGRIFAVVALVVLAVKSFGVAKAIKVMLKAKKLAKASAKAVAQYNSKLAAGQIPLATVSNAQWQSMALLGSGAKSGVTKKLMFGFAQAASQAASAVASEVGETRLSAWLGLAGGGFRLGALGGAVRVGDYVSVGLGTVSNSATLAGNKRIGAIAGIMGGLFDAIGAGVDHFRAEPNQLSAAPVDGLKEWADSRWDAGLGKTGLKIISSSSKTISSIDKYIEAGKKGGK